MPGEGEAGGKAGELVVGRAVDGGQQNLFGAAVVVVGVFADFGCKVVGEGVGVEIDEGAKDGSQLSRGEDGRGLLDDALEGRLALLAEFVALGELCLAFLFFALLLLAAFFCPAFLLLLMSLALCLMLLAALLGLSVGFSLGRGGNNGRGVLGFLCGLTGGCAGVVDGALVVGANGEDGPYALAVDDDCGFGGFAGGYRLGVGVLVGGVDFAEVSTLDAVGPLLARFAPRILDLHQLGTGGDFAVDHGVDFGMKARGVEALVAQRFRIGEEGSVESAAAGAGNASSCRRVQGWVFLAEGGIGKG